MIFGLDHRAGHPAWGRGSPNPQFFRGLGAAAWDVVCWGGRRHDQGRNFYLLVVFHKWRSTEIDVTLDILKPASRRGAASPVWGREVLHVTAA